MNKHKYNHNISHQPGFTIIEVVLVLAIAGLIFLMVFVALPALQRSQRDAARKNDIAMIASAVKNWQSNNRGRKLPIIDDHSEELSSYGVGTIGVTDNGVMSYIKEASMVRFVWIAEAGVTSTGRYDVLDFVRIWMGAKCSGEEKTFMDYYPLTLVPGNYSQIAITTRLENTDQQYCQDI